MRLDKNIWTTFRTYLLFDRKQSDKRSAINANKSRFTILASYFENIDFTRQHFTEFLLQLKGKGYSISYMNNFIKMAKTVDRYYGLNEVRDYTYFPEIRSIPLEIITPEEIEALATVKIPYKKMNSYINQRQRALILLLGTTGCRIGEALSLTFQDIHDTPLCCVFRDTKTNDDRIAPLSKRVHALLMALPCFDKYVFMSGRGKRLEQQPINTDLKIRCKALNIKKNVYCHLFRHSYITTMLESGVDISDVGVLVGHRDPKTTMRYKNSLIGHYVDVAHLHPLLRSEMSWEQQVTIIRSLKRRLMNIPGSNLQLIESENTISVILNKQ